VIPLRLRPTRRQLTATVAVLALLGTAFLLWQRHAPRAITVTAGKHPEELVYARSKDDVINGGMIFNAPRNRARPFAVIWVHGWGANFYYPTYTMIGRALAERGYTGITVNTRMHDLANVEAWRGEKRIRGGGYWGLGSEEVRDIAAWVDFAEDRGFKQVVLVGHSAGWSAVKGYQANTQDPRVVGLVIASGMVRADTDPPDPAQLAEASRLVAEGRGDELVRIPNRSFASYISAATFLEGANTSPEFKDFFGVHTPHPAATRIRCPILAFYATRNDVGNEADLELLKTCTQRLSSGPSRVATVMIQNTDHMYTGEEAQVAEVIARWADALVPPEPRKGNTEDKR
jgi:pimeloyl-ACP methyl ester carboxylesterase